jgi:hypothetical protein
MTRAIGRTRRMAGRAVRPLGEAFAAYGMTVRLRAGSVLQAAAVIVRPPPRPTGQSAGLPSYGQVLAAGPPPTSSGGYALLFGVVGLGVSLRFLGLDADPHYYDWIGYIIDEGRWIDQARELALFGQRTEPGPSLHVLVGPLFQALSYGVFQMLDVSVLSSRLLSALAGSVLLLGFCLGLRRMVSPPALLVATAMLAFERDLIVLSRIAVPEMLLMAVQLLIYLAITSRRRGPSTLAMAGVASFVMIGIKITVLPVIGIFALIVAIQPCDVPWARSRWRDVALFLAGVLSPLTILAAVWAVAWPGGADLVRRSVELLEVFGSPAGLRAPVAYLFENAMAPMLNLWLLALWCALVGWGAAGPVMDSTSRRVLITSVTWIAAYASVMLALHYFPNRYRLHLLVPMAVAIAVGLTLLERSGRSRVDALFAMDGVRGVLWLAFLGLPTAVVAAPIIAQAVALVDGRVELLRVKVVCVLLALGVTTLVLVTIRRRRTLSSVFFLVFPVATTLLWSTGERTGLYDVPFWPTGDQVPDPAGRILMLLLAGAIAGVASGARRDAPGAAFTDVARVSALWYLALCLPMLVASHVTPHYTIRNASRLLATTLADAAEPIGSSGADGLFREGRLRYRTIWARTWSAIRPDVLVVVFEFHDPDAVLEREYCLTNVLPLYVAPEYFRAHPSAQLTSEFRQSVRIYRRRGPDGCPQTVWG